MFWLGLAILAGLSLLLVQGNGSEVSLLRVHFLTRTNSPSGEAWAVFETVNQSSVRSLRFNTVAIELKTGDGWTAFHPTNEWAGLNSWNLPGGRHTLMIPWPPGLATNNVWRLRLAGAVEPLPPQAWINGLLKKELFHTSEMPEIECVVPLVSTQE